MKKYFCDICGKPFNPFKEGKRAEQVPKDAGVFGLAQNGLDICGSCMRIGEAIDFHKAMTREWRQAADVSVH